MKQYVALVNRLPPQARGSNGLGQHLRFNGCAANPTANLRLRICCGRPFHPVNPPGISRHRSFPDALQLRQVSRRGSFFWRKPPSNVPKKGFGKMMQQVCGLVGC